MEDVAGKMIKLVERVSLMCLNGMKCTKLAGGMGVDAASRRASAEP